MAKLKRRDQMEGFRQRFFDAYSFTDYPTKFEFEGVEYLVVLRRKETPEQFETRMRQAWHEAGNPTDFVFEGRIHNFFPEEFGGYPVRKPKSDEEK